MARAAEDLRVRLQRGLRGLRIADGEVLRGLFLGPIDGDEETDVENLLLTNVEIPAGPLAGGFAFEHDPRSPDGCACGYDYRPVDPADPFDLWRPGDLVAGWHAFELQHGLTAPAIWWHARVRRYNDTPDGTHPPARLMVRIEVTAPRPVTLDELKAATDGLLAAAHWMPRATVPDTEKFRVRLRAAGIATSPDQVTGLLRDPAGATLGPRQRLITRGGLVSPSDHLVVAGIVAVTRRPGQTARMTARVHEALAVVSG